MTKLAYLYGEVGIDWARHLDVHQFSHHIYSLGHRPRGLESCFQGTGARRITHKALRSWSIARAREEHVLTTNTDRLEKEGKYFSELINRELFMFLFYHCNQLQSHINQRVYSYVLAFSLAHQFDAVKFNSLSLFARSNLCGDTNKVRRKFSTQ